MKKLLTLLLVCVLMIALVSCQGESEKETPKETVQGISESSEGLAFELNYDGKGYTVTGRGTCKDTHIVIGSYNGLPVTAIGDNAFEGQRNIESITIADCVTSIGPWAFCGCLELNNIKLPNGITKLEKRTFLGCSALRNITIPDSVTEIEEGVFMDCTEIIFQGTKEEWAAIEKHDAWDYDTGDYVVKCTDGEISKSNP